MYFEDKVSDNLEGKKPLTNVFFIKIPFSATGNLGEVYDYKQFYVWKGKMTTKALQILTGSSGVF